jgi:hypothetical protein
MDLLQIWPKIVEYIGLSEYESKVYLSLVNMGVSGARKLSLNCDVPRTKVYGLKVVRQTYAHGFGEGFPPTFTSKKRCSLSETDGMHQKIIPIIFIVLVA